MKPSGREPGWYERWTNRMKQTSKDYSKAEIEQFVLNSQRLKIDAYKQARRAMEKPFSV